MTKEVTKVVYNACFGGFSVSEAALRRYAELKGLTLYVEVNKPWGRHYWTVPESELGGIFRDDEFRLASMEDRVASNRRYSELTLSTHNFSRTDPILVQVVEELGASANGSFADLKIAEVPRGTKYRIDEYDGSESVMTSDDYEWEVA